MKEDIAQRIEPGSAAVVSPVWSVQVDAGEVTDRSKHIVALFLHHVPVDVVNVVGPVMIGRKTFREGIIEAGDASLYKGREIRVVR